MILRRDPRMIWALALMALGIVAVVGVTVVALYRWKDNPAPRYSVVAIYSMGVVMVGTWLLITLASIPDPDVYRAPKQAEQVDTPRKLDRLPPDDFMQLTTPGPIAWPNVTRGKLHRAIQTAVRVGRVSVRVMREAGLTDQEGGAMRDWVLRNGWGTPERGAARLTTEGRDELQRLSPIAAEFRR